MARALEHAQVAARVHMQVILAQHAMLAPNVSHEMNHTTGRSRSRSEGRHYATHWDFVPGLGGCTISSRPLLPPARRGLDLLCSFWRRRLPVRRRMKQNGGKVGAEAATSCKTPPAMGHEAASENSDDDCALEIFLWKFLLEECQLL